MNNKCIYPDWEGNYERGKHNYGNDGFCCICGNFDIKHKINIMKLFEIRTNGKESFIVLANSKEHAKSYIEEFFKTLHNRILRIQSISEVPEFGCVYYSEPIYIMTAQ